MADFDARRRRLLKFASGAGALALAGCDRLAGNAQFDGMLRHGETWTMRTQRLVLAHQPLAREYTETCVTFLITARPRFHCRYPKKPSSLSAVRNCPSPESQSFSYRF